MSEPEDVRPWDERYRRMKRQRSELFAALVLILEAAGVEPAFERASGQTLCSSCGLFYVDHPRWAKFSLYRTCDGKWWHL
jgi:hypothetical protein